jgi:NADH-quinone oxidoreductase subunit G
MPDINLTIDGVPITVPTGTNVVDAARSAGIAIPVFCYHPRLNAVGMCRMCLVQIGTPRIDRETRQPVLDDQGRPVIQMFPKLMTGCTTEVSEGMVVNTKTEEVEFAQRGVLEFLLTSHPLDCPVCDKGGECPLQNLTMQWGPGNSRFDYNEKVHFEKPVPLGNLIYLDRERCILCGRCVRYQDELADDPVLGFDDRGRNWMIISKSDPPFDSKFSGNTTDICPVGALTTADFRFRARVWEVTSVPTVCTLCPVGCNLSLDMRHGKLMRAMPRENSAVNDIWICDKGRFGQRYLEHEDRLLTPLIRRNGNLEPASWPEALGLVAEKLAGIRDKSGGQVLAGLAGARLANEDLYLFQKLFRNVLGSNNIDHGVGAPDEPTADDIGATLGVGVGTDLHQLGAGTTVLVIGADPEEEAPLYMLRLRVLVQRGGRLFVANPRPTKLDRSATESLHYRADHDHLFVRALLGAVLELTGSAKMIFAADGSEALRAAFKQAPMAKLAERAGVAEADIRAMAEAFVNAENGIILYGAQALSFGTALVQDLGSMALLAGKAARANSGLIGLLPEGNSRGALDMGLRPDMGPGYTPSAQPGMGAADILAAAGSGKVRALYLAGSDPLQRNPAAQDALKALEFLVVQDMFLTPAAELADVVLPAAAPAERDGSYTNVERRVQRSRQATALKGAALPDWAIIARLAQALIAISEPQQMEVAAVQGKGKRKGKNKPAEESAVAVMDQVWDYLLVDEVADEIAQQVPGYTGITYARLAATGRPGTWSRQPDETVYYDGTSYENTEGVGLQYPARAEWQAAKLTLAPQPLAEPQPAEGLPFVLLLQPLLYDGDPWLRGSRLQSHVPAPYIGLSRSDAAELNISAGEQVRLRSANGEVEAVARVLSDLPAGCVIVPQNLPGLLPAGYLGGARARVAVSKG